MSLGATVAVLVAVVSFSAKIRPDTRVNLITLGEPHLRFLIRSFQPTDLAPPALEEIDRPNTVTFNDNLPSILTIHTDR